MIGGVAADYDVEVGDVPRGGSSCGEESGCFVGFRDGEYFNADGGEEVNCGGDGVGAGFEVAADADGDWGCSRCSGRGSRVHLEVSTAKRREKEAPFGRAGRGRDTL